MSARGDEALHGGGGIGNPDDPLLHFKLGFSERRFAVHRIRVVLDEAAYGRLTEAAGGGARNGYFPAYRAPRPATTPGANAEAEAEAAAARA